MRDLCALPRNDPSREARNVKVLGGRRLLIGDRCFGDNTLGERGFSAEKENGAGSAGKTVTEERVWVAGTGVSSVTGWSGERSWAGGMFTND